MEKNTTGWFSFNYSSVKIDKCCKTLGTLLRISKPLIRKREKNLHNINHYIQKNIIKKQRANKTDTTHFKNQLTK